MFYDKRTNNENFGIISARCEHTPITMSHVVNYYVDAKCEKHCKQTFDCDWKNGAATKSYDAKACEISLITNHFGDLFVTMYILHNAHVRINFCPIFTAPCASVTDLHRLETML